MLVKPPTLSLTALFELRAEDIFRRQSWAELPQEPFQGVFFIFFIFSCSLGRVLNCAFPALQIRKRLMVSDKGHLEWKKMYFKLSRCYPHREQYSDTLHFCTHCHILFWKVVFHFLFFLFTLACSECETSNLKLHFIVQRVSFKSSVFNCDSKTLQNRSWSENSLVCPLFSLPQNARFLPSC